MKAIEKRRDISRALKQWETLFRAGAAELEGMGGNVYWHEVLGLWGRFGETYGKGGMVRSWNAFGQRPWSFRQNMIVEINVPPAGVDFNIQGVFATDDAGRLWLLHQGRMSIPGSRVTQDDFIAGTGLRPTSVRFSDGTTRPYHKVTPLDGRAAIVQERVAAFVAQCAKARLAKQGASSTVIAALGAVEKWERGLSPEVTGEFEIAARDPVIARRRHAEVWRALAAELERRKVPHSNDRIAQYGPDLFTFGSSDILFEIKAGASSQEVFGGVGQLHIYEQLLNAHYRIGGYRKVLVVPAGMRRALEEPLRALNIATLTYERSGRQVRFDARALAAILK